MNELEQRADDSPDDFAVIPGVIQNMEVVQKATKCVVEGSVPSWLHGDIVRTGPGQFKHGKDMYSSWFDGEAILMKFSIRDNGSIYYQSKFIDTQVRRDHLKHKCIIHGGLGNPSIQDPCQSVFSKIFTQFWHKPKNDNTNVNILQLGEKSYATTDVAIAWKFDLESLSSESSFNLFDQIPIPTTTGHPHYDSNGDYINVGNMVGRESFYTILKIPKEKIEALPDPIREVEIFSKVPVTNSLKPSYFHSFSLTQNYIIVHEQSLKMDVLKILHPFAWKAGMANCFGIDEDFEFKFHVVDKHTGELVSTKYCTKPAVCFHTINAWEEKVDGKNFIVIDLCSSDECYEMFELIKFSNMLQSTGEMTHIKNYPQRFVLPLDVDQSQAIGKMNAVCMVVAVSFCPQSD